jgi:septal ring factor EnvC (AmiA/AmiB activator)
MKGLKGTDKRKYLLDFMRLSPRDLNFVSETDDYLCCVLRAEVLNSYIIAKNLEAASEFLKKEIENDEKKKNPETDTTNDSIDTQKDKEKEKEGEVALQNNENSSTLNQIMKVQEYLQKNEKTNRIRFNANIETKNKFVATPEKLAGKYIHHRKFF